MSTSKFYKGNLCITKDNIDEFRDLEIIDGDLRIDRGARGATLWNLKKITKSLVIKESNAVFPKLRSIGIGCWLEAKNTELPVLTEVPRLTIAVQASGAVIPKLKRVDELMVCTWDVDLSALENVKYKCDIEFDTKLPSLRIVNGSPSGSLGKRGLDRPTIRAEADTSTLLGLSLTF